ncbi:alpha-ketoglutarate-dependent dioxygenase AlkB [Aquihabitans sp. G128]|uniref:alpha-ketoglutarate-dependent dioxygenase AlkB family protein n=1 Tax=Aquihabitans sp. G128 TaxID=2849779 RepID=UPI001C23664F|nr:alpha-ketoglutarate-dependent dioxygenase AlkB [Aquihabitans sp. G128]QXC62942.1 alpha-ketoglutarate-dependent dioxygenase AlkB [Aquihabitans sp. G128]
MASSPAALPDLSWQGSLLGGGEPQADAAFAGARRVELGQGAWVDHVPGWLRGADTLFDQLVDAVPWRAHEIPMYDQVVPEPRLSAWWSQPDRSTWPAHVAAIADALGARYDLEFDSLGTNLYRDGRDSVAWHGDRVYREQDRSLVAVLSLGSTRRFLLRPAGGGASVRFEPAPGDLLVMGGTCQRTWQHCVPKSAQLPGPRISVTLRPTSLLPPDRRVRRRPGRPVTTDGAPAQPATST